MPETYEDTPYDPEQPEMWVRCKLCGAEVEADQWELHWADCEIIPWEQV